MDSNVWLPVIAVATPSTIGLVISFVQWLGSRTIQREDADKKKVEERLENHEKRLTEMDRAFVAIQADLRASGASLSEVRGAVGELKAGLDVRFERQSEFYRTQVKEMMTTFGEKLDKLEFDLRQQMSRALADSQPRRRRKE